MFTVGVKRQFTARHYLIGGNWGSENEIHSHCYALEVTLEGPKLNEHGYLVDIVEIEERLDKIIARLQDSVLNELPEFAGLNPSIEHLADQCCRLLLEVSGNPPLTAVSVKVFENDNAWASCRLLFY